MTDWRKSGAEGFGLTHELTGLARLFAQGPVERWVRRLVEKGKEMQIEPLVKIDQVQEGDLLLISDGRELTHAKAQRVKVSEHDGTEVIFNLRKNKFFNVGMYLDGKSWAKDVRIVRMPSNAIAQGREHSERPAGAEGYTS